MNNKLHNQRKSEYIQNHNTETLLLDLTTNIVAILKIIITLYLYYLTFKLNLTIPYIIKYFTQNYNTSGYIILKTIIKILTLIRTYLTKITIILKSNTPNKTYKCPEIRITRR